MNRGDLLYGFDNSLIRYLRRISIPLARVAIFVVYGWFGILKVVGLSPANPLVAALQHRTLPFLDFGTFIVLFGLFEVIIGILFLVPRWERVAIPLMAFHMLTTLMPLVFLPRMTWSAPFVPTLEGQYIIKNLALIALAIGLGSRLVPWSEKRGQ